MLIYRIIVCVIMFVAMVSLGYGALTNMNTEKDRDFARLCVLGAILSAMGFGMSLSAIMLS